MTLGSTRDKTVLQVSYIAASSAVGTGAYLLSRAESGLDALIAIVVFGALGPLGLVASTMLFPPLLSLVGAASGVSWFAAVLISPAAAGIAYLNIVAVYGYLARVQAGPKPTNTSAPANKRSRAWAAALFIVAGCLFFLLCVLAVLAVLVGSLYDQDAGGQVAAYTFAALVWFPGLLVAGGGMLVWIVDGARERSLLSVALADALIQLALVVILVFGAVNLL